MIWIVTLALAAALWRLWADHSALKRQVAALTAQQPERTLESAAAPAPAETTTTTTTTEEKKAP
ncbi:hypothetical protein GVN21_19465 [Caulobacter sp. SLTY]|uniref:hypothetical protein n=1 Tax=Caulobacter sp. SLTY TaxID=2683262 RepID=UPI001412437C|nr:hypothetical protein [Caulobacter sp. SLTY]NBB17546.1 hypothetical protein [Caulobacter sp. SLTY]